MGAESYLKTKAYKENEDFQDNRFVELANSIIRFAVKKRASDIHFEVLNRKNMRARIRVDGQLSTFVEIGERDYFGIVSRIKILANMDIAEKRRPQDGSFNVLIDHKSIDLRVSIIPALYGEKVVLRILDAQTFLLPIAKLGFSKENEKTVCGMAQKANGLILVTGPTGCGKSTTLYSILQEQNADETNIVTIEDPIEFHLEGINQMQVNEKIGLSFTEGLRSILRQDPNIIMIGEIRDEQTAATAVRASITGHLVLSTLHTNDAFSSVTRLFDMGVPSYLLQAAIRGIIAQRLLRRLCPHCKRPDRANDWEQQYFGFAKSQTLFRAVGCRYCGDTGYFGRKGVFEVLDFNKELRSLLMPDTACDELQTKAIEQGFIGFSQIIKNEIIKGITDTTEGLRVMSYGND